LASSLGLYLVLSSELLLLDSRSRSRQSSVLARKKIEVVEMGLDPKEWEKDISVAIHMNSAMEVRGSASLSFAFTGAPILCTTYCLSLQIKD
jgi:hypothetical protein